MASPDPARLSLNTATIRKQWGLAEAIEGCARHGIRGISPWRDQVAGMGLAKAVEATRAAGLTVTGLCRGGFFSAPNWRDDNLRAIEEAHELGASCLVLVVGGMPPGSKDLAGARNRMRDAGRHRATPAAPPRRGRAAPERAAAPDAGRARLREHARAGARSVRRARRAQIRGARRRGGRVPPLVGPEARGADQARGRRAHPRLPHLRLARADAGPPQRPRHDGRRRDRPAPNPLLARARGLRGLPRGRDLLRARLVGARPGRRADDLQGAPRALLLAVTAAAPCRARPAKR